METARKWRVPRYDGCYCSYSSRQPTVARASHIAAMAPAVATAAATATAVDDGTENAGRPNEKRL